MSIDLFGLRDGSLYTPLNSDKSEIKQEFELGVGVVSGGVEKTIKAEGE